jgi:hypothetical protein
VIQVSKLVWAGVVADVVLRRHLARAFELPVDVAERVDDDRLRLVTPFPQFSLEGRKHNRPEPAVLVQPI